MRQRIQSARRALILLLVVGIVLPHVALAQPKPEAAAEPRPNPFVMGADVLFMRPLGLVAAAVGAVLFVPVALISAPQGKDGLDEAFELFVTVPADAVFRRPLGEF